MRACVLALLLAGCAPKALQIPGPLSGLDREPNRPAARVERPDKPAPGDAGGRIAKAAEALVAGAAAPGFRDDCSGFVCAALHRAGLDVDGHTEALWEQAERQRATHRDKRPAVGDLVFFDDTYDRNSNGRRDDPLSHVGIVTAVAADGTITVAHRGSSRGRSTFVMNLLHPHDKQGPSGQPWNDALRASADRDQGPVLASELWRGFGRVDVGWE